MFGHCSLEDLLMHWRKRDIWKAGIAIASMLLLLVLIVWVPVSAAGVHEVASGFAGPGTVTVQATPTVDLTVTALNKEQLAQQIKQLQLQNDRSIASWFWNSGGTLGTIVAGLLAVAGVLVTVVFNLRKDRKDRQEAHRNELKDRQEARAKQAEERFQSAVTGLGDEKEGAKIGAAILLRTFLRPGYEQFYTQTFDLAVAHLRLPSTPHPPDDPNTAMPLTTLRQALIVVFKEAFPLARSQNNERPQSLDARGIQLDNAYLRGADLKLAWMPRASLRKVNLRNADLNGAHLRGADLTEAHLRGADLTKADLRRADLRGAYLNGAHLTEAYLCDADLSKAHLTGADLTKADLGGAHLTEANLNIADLSGADLSGADLRGATLSVTDLTKADLSEADLSGADLGWAKLENVLSLANAKLGGVKGLTKEQLEACKAKDAIIDEDSTISLSQSSVSPPPTSQSSDVQAQSAISAQGGTPISDIDRSSATSSQQSNDPQAPSATSASE